MPAAIQRILGRIKRQDLGPVDLAELRRLRPEEPGGSAYWRLVLEELEPHNLLRSEDAERRWALVLRAVACLHEHHSWGWRVGRSLAEAHVHDKRMERLLRADLDACDLLLRALTCQLDRAGQSVDLAELAQLVLSARTGNSRQPYEAAVRQRVARDYYRALYRLALTAAKAS